MSEYEHTPIGGAAAGSEPERARRSGWGRARFGGGVFALALASLTIGVVASGAIAWAFASLVVGERPWLGFAIMLAGMLPVCTIAGWALLVDRSSLSGAVARPEESVEMVWYQRASSGAFGDILLVGGIGALGFSLAPVAAPIAIVLGALLVFAMLDFGVRYLWQKTSDR